MAGIQGRIFLGAPLSGKTTRLIETVLEEAANGGAVERMLFLTFSATNTRTVRKRFEERGLSKFPTITTLQSFSTRLLKRNWQRAGLSLDGEVISAAARSLLIGSAWAQTGGALYAQFGASPDAVKQLTLIFDWLSTQRAQFRGGAGEFSAHELARAYARYVELCEEQQLLTFQEATLRCLDLLKDEPLAAQVRARYDAILIDDLDQAHAEQLSLIERLVGPETSLVASGWLEKHHADAELRHVWKRVSQWAEIEWLATGMVPINPAVRRVVERVMGKVSAGTGLTQPVVVATPFSAEDEVHAVARAMVRTLSEQPELKPAELAVVVADDALTPFLYRIFPRHELALPPEMTSAQKNPLIRGTLLGWEWLNGANRYAVERELFQLPFLRLNALDYARLYGKGDGPESRLGDLEGEGTVSFAAPEETLATLKRVVELKSAVKLDEPLERMLWNVAQKLGGLEWAWNTYEFPSADCDKWFQGLVAWLKRVKELEAVGTRLGLERNEVAARLGELEEEREKLPERAEYETCQLTQHRATNGVAAKYAFVVGAAETVMPKRTAPWQLLEETELAGLFADGREVILPELRKHSSWIEREARLLAGSLSRGSEGLYVSVSQYGVGGDFQLPTPFFERLLGQDGEIGRDGNLVAKDDGLWRHEATAEDVLETPLEEKEAGAANSSPVGDLVLQEHVFSPAQIKRYLACPLQFYYARVLQIETEGAMFLDRGNLLHEVLCAAIGDGKLSRVNLKARSQASWDERKQNLKPRVERILEAAWSGLPSELGEGETYTPSRIWSETFGPQLQRQAVRKWAQNVVEKWVVYELEGMPESTVRRPLFLEVPFTLELDGYRLRGRIDRIDAIERGGKITYEIVDYKTGSSTKGSLNSQISKFLPTEGKKAEDYQIPLYAMALKQGVEKITALPEALHYINLEELEKNKKDNFGADARRTFQFPLTGTLDVRKGRVPLGVLEGQVEGAILETLAAMQHSPYPATPDYQTCKYCDFAIACDKGHNSIRGGQ